VRETMKSKIRDILLAASISLLSLSAVAAVVDKDSDGYIEINNLDDLNEIRNSPGGGAFRGSSEGCPGGNCFGFELTRDLDFDTNKNGVLDSGDWNSGQSWIPIQATAFIFNGNGHSIKNFFTATPNIVTTSNGFEYQYGFVNPTSYMSFENVRFVNPKVIAEGSIMPTNSSPQIGVVSGKIPSFSVVKNINIENAVITYSRSLILPPLEGFVMMGGAAGSATGIVYEVYFSGTISGNTSQQLAGGLIGSGNNLIIYYIGTSGSITGSGNLGGIIGSGNGIKIYNSYSTINFTNSGTWSVGGIAGVLFDFNTPNELESVHSSSLINAASGGGLVGSLFLNGSSIEIKSSFSTATVTHDSQSYAQLIDNIQPDSLVLNLDSYQVVDPNGISLPAEPNSYNPSVLSQSIKCATNPINNNCADPFLLSSWNPVYWDFGTDIEYPRLILPIQFPWYSTDSENGGGDYETIRRLKEHVPQYSCDNPIDFQVKEKKSGYVFSAKTPETFNQFNAKQGLKCTDSEQADGRCDNYEVSYLCGGSGIVPQWSNWLSQDNNSNDGQDNEPVPANVCASGSPIGIRTRIVNQTNEFFGSPQIPYGFTLTKGFSCLNNDNGPAGRFNCKDYEVRMVCNVKSSL
jgi:Mucin-2 protein WxxW repeating region